MEATRIDRWLWAVRVFRTRSAATEACNGGHVRVNGASAKPSTPVRVGHTVEVHVARRDRIFEVSRIIDTRVSASLAAECYVDHSPPPPPREMTAPAFHRDPGAGRPTKRERRDLDRFRGR